MDANMLIDEQQPLMLDYSQTYTDIIPILSIECDVGNAT